MSFTCGCNSLSFEKAWNLNKNQNEKYQFSARFKMPQDMVRQEHINWGIRRISTLNVSHVSFILQNSGTIAV